MSPDPYDSRLDKLFVKLKNAPIGVGMKSWQPLQLGSVLQSESNIQNMLDLDFFFPCTKSNVVGKERVQIQHILDVGFRLQDRTKSDVVENIRKTWAWSPINFFGPSYFPCNFHTKLYPIK
jgi:hypothetical protein